jgi:hypothetical protein
LNVFCESRNLQEISANLLLLLERVVKLCIGVVLALACVLEVHAQTFSCLGGSEDVMNYFLMAYPSRVSSFLGPGNANPVYSSITPDYLDSFATNGFFVWTKSSAGYPWDVKAFDTKYVYDRTTELNWGDPTSFKRFDQDLPIAHRCVKVGKAGPSIKVTSANTVYSFYAQCTSYETSVLGYAINTLSAPTLVNAGGNVGQISTRLFKYHYGCDSTYSNCTDMEVFSLINWDCMTGSTTPARTASGCCSRIRR